MYRIYDFQMTVDGMYIVQALGNLLSVFTACTVHVFGV